MRTRHLVIPMILAAVIAAAAPAIADCKAAKAALDAAFKKDDAETAKYENARKDFHAIDALLNRLNREFDMAAAEYRQARNSYNEAQQKYDECRAVEGQDCSQERRRVRGTLKNMLKVGAQMDAISAKIDKAQKDWDAAVKKMGAAYGRAEAAHKALAEAFYNKVFCRIRFQ
jgi:hypothetical protein